MNSTAVSSNYQSALRQFCAKCNSISATNEKNCLQCGEKLETVNRIRATGAISVTLGIALLVAMSWLSLWIYNTVNAQSPNAARFNGNARELDFIVVVLGLVSTISFFSVVAGLWQLIFGKRNRILKYIVLVSGLAFIGMGLMFSMA